MGSFKASELKHIENLCRNVKKYVFNAKPKKKNCPRANLKEPHNNSPKEKFWSLGTSNPFVVVAEQQFFKAIIFKFLSLFFKWCRITMQCF